LTFNKKCKIENVDLTEKATDEYINIMKHLPLKMLTVSYSQITNKGLAKAADYWYVIEFLKHKD
jgi:hypothetical protein